ncbi:hypothetical protein M422DRAFT_38413 [Sphaerobolus stellatus SS14]|uniref:Uncharacterized protein n=1 Tax=Sphaerobolus stellatus (strain SS14) TaxID=990650 RepID=A0A0C9UKM6_SPHS4|nr:hypothetical protein M422DRAFT_38413 [Sphaerobolus stellatus SS14]
MSNIRGWARNTQPGPPAPPSERSHSVASSLSSSVYPSSSVSNPDSSRYRRRAASTSAPSHGASRSYHTAAPTHYSSSRRDEPARSSAGSGSGSHHSSARRSSRDSGSTTRVPTTTYVAPNGKLPVIARTVTPGGKTSSYVIIPGEGQRVEVLEPDSPNYPVSYSPRAQRSGVSYAAPARSHHSGTSYTLTSPTKSKSLFRKVMDRVSSPSRSPSSVSYQPSHARTRRNSTGGSGGGWSVISGGNRIAGSGSVTTVKSGGRRYDVIRV